MSQTNEAIDLDTKFDHLPHTYGDILQLLFDNYDEFPKMISGDEIVGVCFFDLYKLFNKITYETKVATTALHKH